MSDSYANGWLINLNTDVSFQLYDDVTYIGRSADSDLVIHDQTVSRNHALIRYENGAFLLVVQEAQVPVEVNGFIIDHMKQLHHDDEILFGSTPYRFINAGL